MKKVSKVFLLAMLVLTAFSSAFAAKKSKGDNSGEDFQKRKVFVLGLDDSFPPLGFRNEKNQIVGYDIDLAKEVAKRLGVKFKAQPIQWDAKEQELNTGKIDCIWNGFTITAERQQALSFTKAYLDNEQVVVVKANSGITKLSDLA